MIMSQSATKSELYKTLSDAYFSAHSTKMKKTCQIEVNELWNKLKSEPDLEMKVKEHVVTLKAIELHKKGSLMVFWSKASKPTVEKKIASPLPVSVSESDDIVISAAPSCSITSELATDTSKPAAVSTALKCFITPVQDKLKLQLSDINSSISDFVTKKRMGLSTDENEGELRALKKRKISLELELKKKVDGQKRQREFRQVTKTKIQTVANMNPEAKRVLHDRVRLAPGRPRLEEDQVGLLKSLCDIAIFGSAAHDRRQSDIMRSIKTLDELTAELQKLGYKISRSATYLRLLPRRCNTTEGKRHITTVPVKLI